MVIRIARSAPLLWRNPSDMQIGSAPDAVRLASLSDAEQRLLRLLQLGIHEPDFARMAADVGVADDRRDLIREAVEPMLEVASDNPSANQGVELSQEFIDSAIGEIVRANLVSRIDGESVLRARQQKQVFIEQLDRTGLMLARALSAAGVGRLVSTDSKTVTLPDVGADGYPARARFANRVEAAQLIVSQGYSGTTAELVAGHPTRVAKSDIAILIAQGSIQPDRHQAWLRMGVPHLAIVFSDAGPSVSRLVESGGRPCLLCEELNRTDADSAWPVLAAQLARTSAEFADTASRWWVVAEACRRILARLDQPTPKSRAIEGHPECPCLLGPNETGKKS